MTHVTCRLTAKNRDQLRNPTLCCWVWASFTFFTTITRRHSWWGMHVTGGNERGRMFGSGAQHRWSNFDHSGCMAGFVSCKKKNRNAKNMASAGARAYMGVCGRCPQRGPGQSPWWGGQGGEAPLKLKAFYCQSEQIWILFIIGLLNFAAICRKGPERRSGDQKKNRNGVPAGNEPWCMGEFGADSSAPRDVRPLLCRVGR